MTDLRPPAIFLPNAKSRVAPSVSHGSTRIKVCAGVLSSRYAPVSPPTRLAVNSGIITRRGTSSRLRYAPPLAAAPVQSAIVFVAFAGIGGTPVNNSAGNAIKLPPPATAFSAPPSAPAKIRKIIMLRVKLLGVPETTSDRQPSGSGYYCDL